MVVTKMQNSQNINCDSEIAAERLIPPCKIAEIKKMKAVIETYIDLCIYILNTVFLADFIWRFSKFVREYFCYRNHYLPEQVPWSMLKRAYTYNRSTCFGFVLLVIAVLLRFGSTSRFTLAPAYFLAFMPLYWLWCGLNCAQSPLDYADWTRERHGLDFAGGMANNYFHGYLKLTLPSYTEHPGIRERIELYSAQENVTFAWPKLVILLPTDMFLGGKIESRILEKAKPLEIVMKNRAGVLRPYKNDVYRITERINGEFLYVVLEGATPLTSFYESERAQPTSTWQMREMRREILLKFYRELKKLLNDYPETRNLVELVIYNTYAADGSLQDVGELLKARIMNLKKSYKTE